MFYRSKLCVTHSQLVAISISLLLHFQNGSCGYQEWKLNFYPETTSDQYTNTEYRIALRAKLRPLVLFNTEPTVEDELKSLGGFFAGTPPQREPPLETSKKDICVVSASPFKSWTFWKPADIIKSLDKEIELKQTEFIELCGDRKPVQTALYCGFLFTGETEGALSVNKFVFVISSIVDNSVQDAEPVATLTSTDDVSAHEPVDGVGDGAEGDGNDQDTSVTGTKEGPVPKEKGTDEHDVNKNGANTGVKANPPQVQQKSAVSLTVGRLKRKLERVLRKRPDYDIC